AQQTWLTQQLADADLHAKYTFVSKHHPDGNTDHPEFQQIYDLVTAHKYTLFFTGHTHEYRRQRRDSRALVIGCGGAPLANSGGFWGYGTALQGPDDRIYVTEYDQATRHVIDQFDVGPHSETPDRSQASRRRNCDPGRRARAVSPRGAASKARSLQHHPIGR